LGGAREKRTSTCVIRALSDILKGYHVIQMIGLEGKLLNQWWR
jgi:hypothetical protein